MAKNIKYSEPSNYFPKEITKKFDKAQKSSTKNTSTKSSGKKK